MKSMIKLGAGGAMLAALSLGALAQEAPTPPAPSPATPEVKAPESMPAPVEPSLKPALPSDKTADAGSYSTVQSADELRSTKLVGLTVYNEKNESVGDINDLILASDGKVTSVVVGVGGFLGMGEKAVAVPYGDLAFGRDENGILKATISMTKQVLESAPAFKYNDKS